MVAKLANVIGYGLLADRPAAGAPGALYCASDTATIYRDNGTTWDVVATATNPAVTVVRTAVDLVLTQAHVLVVLEANGLNLTLPDPADCAGLFVHTVGATGSIYQVNIYNPPGTLWVEDAFAIFNYISDGTAWHYADY